MNEDLYQKLQQDLQGEIQKQIQASEDAKKRLPTQFRIGPRTTLRESAERLFMEAYQQVKHNRLPALDAQAKLEGSALTLSAINNKKNLVGVLEVVADVIPGWRQERPPDDAGTIPELAVDKSTGLRIRNPWLPLPPLKPGEKQPHFDYKSQEIIKEQSPRLAKWLQDCVKNGGQPSAAMLDALEYEKLEADHLRKVPYGEKEWQANRLRVDSGASLTERMAFAKSVTDPWLLQLHRSEAKLGSPRAGFDNLTHRMALAKRNPEVREVHRQAGEILRTWQAEQQQKKEAA